MLKHLLTVVLLVAGCGRDKGHTLLLPTDLTTPQERQKITSALAIIQKELDANGIDKRVNSIPIMVAELEDPNVRGRCYRNLQGEALGIVLTRALVADDSYDENLYPWYFTVLLHEIGHCFFSREHEHELVQFSDENLVFPNVTGGPQKSLEYTMAWLSPSVMSTRGDRMMLKQLAPYYIREIAGLDRVHRWEDLMPYAQVELRPRTDAITVTE